MEVRESMHARAIACVHVRLRACTCDCVRARARAMGDVACSSSFDFASGHAPEHMSASERPITPFSGVLSWWTVCPSRSSTSSSLRRVPGCTPYSPLLSHSSRAAAALRGRPARASWRCGATGGRCLAVCHTRQLARAHRFCSSWFWSSSSAA
jgi:hypothetical protein